jgi:uncharacterized membrane protein YhaH (DUF805 family)
MGSFSIWHLLILCLVGCLAFLVLVWPTVRILHKAGYSGWWCLLGFVPAVNLVMLYIFAFAADWPNLVGKGDVRQFD